MRHQVLVVGLCASTLASGCGLVFGISPGEYDPDPFGLGGGGGGAGGGAGGAGGGAGGAGASDAGAEPPPCTALLDDLEDGDSAILTCEGRVGSWYTYNDGTRSGTQTPLPGRPFVPVSPGHASEHAAHVAGSGFTTRGAGMGFDLNLAPGGAKLSYDASAYAGLTFWAKAAAPTHIYVNLPDRNTDREGGVCEGSGCGDHFGEGLDLTTEWAQYTVMFSILSTDGWGVPAPPAFDAAHAYSVEFHTAKSTVFDMLVDDIAFVP
ncbi:hypothetical protein AB3662_29435 [Sorangium cellulosum]|uniref:hypothetical protein n=1 Tax=Sorangium cellulosum TaxID=56 RepID=UPI003D9A678E